MLHLAAKGALRPRADLEFVRLFTKRGTDKTLPEPIDHRIRPNLLVGVLNITWRIDRLGQRLVRIEPMAMLLNPSTQCCRRPPKYTLEKLVRHPDRGIRLFILEKIPEIVGHLRRHQRRLNKRFEVIIQCPTAAVVVNPALENLGHHLRYFRGSQRRVPIIQCVELTDMASVVRQHQPSCGLPYLTRVNIRNEPVWPWQQIALYRRHHAQEIVHIAGAYVEVGDGHLCVIQNASCDRMLNLQPQAVVAQRLGNTLWVAIRLHAHHTYHVSQAVGLADGGDQVGHRRLLAQAGGRWHQTAFHTGHGSIEAGLVKVVRLHDFNTRVVLTQYLNLVGTGADETHMDLRGMKAQVGRHGTANVSTGTEDCYALGNWLAV